jgi:hypothetical protein
MEMSKFQVRPIDGKLLQPFNIQLKGLSLEHFVRVIGRSRPMGIFKQLGRVDGELVFQSNREMNGQIDLKNLIVSFSNQSVTGRQKISLVRTSLDFSGGRFSGIVNTVSLKEGLFAGDVSFNFDSAFRSGVIRAKVKELNFSPSVQNLLVGGEILPLELYGQAKVEQGEFEHWVGHVGTAGVRTRNLQTGRAKFLTEWKRQDQELKGKLSVESLHLEKSLNLSEVLHPLFLRPSTETLPTHWKGLHANISVKSDGGSWKQLGVLGENGEQSIKLSSQGAWKRDGEIVGQINTKMRGLPSLEWNLIGDRKRLSAFPSSAMLRGLAKRAERLSTKDQALDHKVFESLKARRELFVKKKSD